MWHRRKGSEECKNGSCKMLQVWRGRAQVQRVSIVEEKGGAHGKAMKGTVRREASMPRKGKGAGKGEEVEKSRGRRSSVHG